MSKLLINNPQGVQEIITVNVGGGYFDASRVIWDERADGTLPAITLGGMKRVGNELVFDEQLITAHNAVKDAEQAKSVRASRDTKLSETDWRFRSDMTPSQAWKDYCQALRDVPTQSGFPWTITWPDAP
jgi:hypothetical protein